MMACQTGNKLLLLPFIGSLPKNAVICLCALGHAQSEGTGWGAVWNCYVVAAYELTQMVSPSATLLTHLRHWVRVRVCVLQRWLAAYTALSEASAWGWEHCLTPLCSQQWLSLKKKNCPFLSNLCYQTSAIYLDYSIIPLYHKNLPPWMGTDHVCDWPKQCW